MRNLFLALVAAFSFNLPHSAEAANCGGLNQRPCKIFERVPSCNRGLIERPLGKRCIKPPTPPKPTPIVCGANGQRACKVFERIPSCNPGLAEIRGGCTSCGAKGQIPCPVTVRVPSCNNGLIEDLARNRCIVPTNPGDRFRAKAEAEARAIAPLIAEIWLGFGPMARKQNIETFKAIVDARDPIAFQRRIESQRRISAIYALLSRYGFNTLTVGISSGISIGGGAALETGVSLDTIKRTPAYLYQSRFFSGGVQASVGNDLAISAFYDRNGCIGGKAIGIGGSFDVGTGHGLVMWFDFKNDRFLGFTTSTGLGSVGGGGFAGEATTQVQGRC